MLPLLRSTKLTNFVTSHINHAQGITARLQQNRTNRTQSTTNYIPCCQQNHALKRILCAVLTVSMLSTIMFPAGAAFAQDSDTPVFSDTSLTAILADADYNINFTSPLVTTTATSSTLEQLKSATGNQALTTEQVLTFNLDIYNTSTNEHNLTNLDLRHPLTVLLRNPALTNGTITKLYQLTETGASELKEVRAGGVLS